jgi:hypothetical protein
MFYFSAARSGTGFLVVFLSLGISLVDTDSSSFASPDTFVHISVYLCSGIN